MVIFLENIMSTLFLVKSFIPCYKITFSSLVKDEEKRNNTYTGYFTDLDKDEYEYYRYFVTDNNDKFKIKLSEVNKNLLTIKVI